MSSFNGPPLAGLAAGDSILVVNAGSSSLKVQLLPSKARVHIERIGENGVADHAEAFRLALARLKEMEPSVSLIACGHRVVHGGSEFIRPVIIDDTVLAAIDGLGRLAPLHNPGGLKGIRAAMSALPHLPHVAVFDTAFHTGMPDRAKLTGLPWEFAERHGIINYGFHGTNHDHVTSKAAELLGRPRSELKLLSLHLGNGASAAAVRYGRSIDTTMGFTPLSGLLMGTRPGDLDPGIVLHLLAMGYGRDELDDLLNRQSGLRGMSGLSNDMRDVRVAAQQGDRHARQALDLYAYRVRKAIGAFTAAMDGLDAIVFTAGVGENDSQLREEILIGMEWLGVQLDSARNAAGEAVITTDASRVKALVIEADEELMIALETLALTKGAVR